MTRPWSEEEIERRLRETEGAEPPEGLLELIRNDVPEELSLSAEAELLVGRRRRTMPLAAAASIILALGVGYMALLARTTRAAVVEVLTKDFVRTARSKGLSEIWINRKHVFRNTLVLLLTSAGLQFGSLIGETVVVETLFS